MKKQLLTLALLTGFSNAALAGGDCVSLGSANLIQNCSFEEPITATTGFGSGGFTTGANTSDLEAWLFDDNAAGTTEKLSGWNDATNSPSGKYYAEVRSNARGIGSTTWGNNFLELDTQDYLGGISQTVDLVAGTDYTLSFYYNWRAEDVNNSQGFRVSIIDLNDVNDPNDNTVAVFDNFDGQGSTKVGGVHVWTLEELMYTSQAGGKYNVVFEDLGVRNSVGASIDNIALTGVAAVPEPETYAMFLMGLGLLGFAARKQKKS